MGRRVEDARDRPRESLKLRRLAVIAQEGWLTTIRESELDDRVDLRAPRGATGLLLRDQTFADVRARAATGVVTSAA